MKQILFYLSCAVFLVLTACTEPITVGSDLLEGDRAELGQTVDIPFTTRVVREDSLLVYDASLNASSPFSIGITEDDVFGKWRNSAYVVPVVFRNSVSGLPAPPTFSYTDRNVDSVVLIIPIDTSYGFYGPERAFPFTARLIDGRVDQEIDYFSSVELPVETATVNDNAVLNASLEPTLLYDTLYSALPNRDSVVEAHIRVRLNDDFLAEVNASNDSVFNGEDAFAELLGGIYIEPADGTDGILALEPLRTNVTATAGLYFFFKDTSAAETPRFYRAPLGLWPPRFEKDYTGSLTADLLADGDDGERLALSGQSGTMIEITFTDLDALNDKVINKAEMFFFRELVDGYSYDTYPSPEFVGLYYRDDNGDLQSVVDRDAINVTGSSALAFLGGDELFDENNNPFYNPRFTVHLQRMISGDLPPTIYLRVLPIDRDASRVIISGPEAAVRPASIKVTFTTIGG